MEHDHVRLKAIEWFIISGRGKVAVVDMTYFPPGRKLLVGDRVYIDDKLYLCNGVEMSSGMTLNKKQGILVKEID